MAINDKPCGGCKNYDPILGSGERPKRRGWCIPRSLYPAEEGPGQIFPAGVKRVNAGELAKPYIVKKDYVHPMCGLYKVAENDAAALKASKQVAATTKGGRRVHR
jgi:hypothetical protein